MTSVRLHYLNIISAFAQGGGLRHHSRSLLLCKFIGKKCFHEITVQLPQDWLGTPCETLLVLDNRREKYNILIDIYFL